jgi:hypothetical protein
VGRRRIPRLGVAFAALPVLAVLLSGCTIFGWTPPGGTRGDVERTDAVLRAIMVAEEHITPPLYDVLACGGEDPCDTDALMEAVDAETAALQAALDAHPDDCLADTARTDLEAYAELRKTATARGDAFFEATGRYEELKYASFVATLDCPFLTGSGDEVDRSIRRASAAGWKGVTDALACQDDACLRERGQHVAEDARAAVGQISPHVDEAPEGCQREYVASTLALLVGYADIGDLLGAGNIDGATVRTTALDAEDNRVMRAFVECLDTTSSGGGWAPAPTSTGNA